MIESLIIGIPIPSIYLASDNSKFPHVSNVIDGQHRLTAIYRFINNLFSLDSLEKVPDFNGKKFEKLPEEIRNKLLFQTSLRLEYIHVQNNKDLETEIFTRYNKGTHPLTAQEIRDVVYGSKFSDWVSNLVTKLKEDAVTKNIYNITKKRLADRAVHSEIHVLFSIAKDGIDNRFVGSPLYAKRIMAEAKKMNNTEIENLINQCENFINLFNKFLKETYVEKGIQNPLSKQIWGTKVYYKCQISILISVVLAFKFILRENIDYLKNCSKIKSCIEKGFLESGFSDVSNATTKGPLLEKTSSAIIDKIKNEFQL